MRRRILAVSAALVLAVSLGIAVTGSAAAPVPIRAAFYYPWFPETEKWQTQYHPSFGKYDSSNETVLAAHVSQAKYAGLDAFIASYWGEGSKTATRLPLLLDGAQAQTFKIAPYYEPASQSPTAAILKADFDALALRSTHPAWLTVGKPVLFVYNTGSEATCSAVAKYKTAAAGRFYLNLKVFAGYRTCSNQPDSWHQYGPASAYDRQSAFSATVSPGFWKFNETSPRLVRDLARFKTNLASQIASGAQWQLTTTFNEWGEGSAVEPATEWQSSSGAGDYLDAMRSAYLGLPPTPSPSESQSESPSVTLSPSMTETPTSSPSTTDTPSTPSTDPSPSTTTTTDSPSTSPSPTPTSPTPTSPTPSTTTTSVADPVIAAAGDIACAPGASVGTSCQHKAVSDKILADTAVETVLLLGDNQYEAGTLTAYQQAYDPTWGRFKDKTKPVPGNHEYGTPNATGYYDYFGALAGDRTKGYYSFDVGAWHFIALNSEKDTATTGAQVAWLKADLASTKSKCVAAYWHKPRWSSGSSHGDNATMNAFVQPLYDADADLILGGHDHDYERFYPLNPSGVRDDARGLVQIVSGEGGRSHYQVAGRATTVTKDNTAYGYSRLTLHEDSATIQFVPAVGTYTDVSTLTCH